MAKKCIICNNEVKEECGKLQGTMLKVKNEENKNMFVHVCSECQKQEEWMDKAKIKSV